MPLPLAIVTAALLCLAQPLRAADLVAEADSLPVVRDSVHIGASERGSSHKPLHHIDSLLDRRDLRERQRVDTAYRQRATERLRLKVSFNGSGSAIMVEGMDQGTAFRSEVEAQNKYTMTLAASYRGLSASIAINPAHLTGRHSDMEFNINAYGNRLGADVVYQYASTFEGFTEMGGTRTDVASGLVSQRAIMANAYYVFNSRRFSYPAAFTQSWVQRRSCGSLMLGMQVYAGWLHIEGNAMLSSADTRFNMLCGAIGVGYGYNLVTRRGWLFHLSSLPEVVVFNRSRLTTDGIRGKMPYRFPNVLVVGRLAVVRHFQRWFIGTSAVVNTAMLGDSEELCVNNLKWRARVFVGLKIF